MKKIYYRKLVRDRIPERIKESGGKSEVRKLTPAAFKRAILAKAEEEAGGLAKAKSKKEIVSEMGDLLDVLKEIKRVYQITARDLKASREKEMKRKGGFAKRIFLIWAEDTGYRSNEKRGKK